MQNLNEKGELGSHTNIDRQTSHLVNQSPLEKMPHDLLQNGATELSAEDKPKVPIEIQVLEWGEDRSQNSEGICPRVVESSQMRFGCIHLPDLNLDLTQIISPLDRNRGSLELVSTQLMRAVFSSVSDQLFGRITCSKDQFQVKTRSSRSSNARSTPLALRRNGQ